jgi:hypothetical protein
LVIFCISWKLTIGSINDIYETLTRFLSMKLCNNSVISCGFSINWIFASWTKIHFNPFKRYFNDIRDYMGVQSIFGLFLQLNWKETTFVTSWKMNVKTSFNIPLKKSKSSYNEDQQKKKWFLKSNQLLEQWCDVIEMY